MYQRTGTTNLPHPFFFLFFLISVLGVLFAGATDFNGSRPCSGSAKILVLELVCFSD